jgi:tetratricopeptide (TPR) repeat protein
MYRITLITTLLLISSLSILAQTNGKDLITASYSAESVNNYSLALEKMKALETQDTTDAFYKLRIGWLLYLSGKYNEALSYYQKSDKLNPCVDAQIGIVNCYLYLGLWNDAIAVSKDILQTYPDYADVLLKAGYAAYMKKEYAQAINYYQKALLVNPYSFEARGYLVPAYYYNGNINEAKKHYQFLKKYYPASLSVKDFAKVLD